MTTTAKDAPVPSWTGLDETETAIEALAEKARVLREPSPARGREFLQVLVQEVPVQRFDYGTREITYYNGDRRDLVVDRLSCFVYRLTSANARIVLSRVGGGYLPAYTGTGNYPVPGWAQFVGIGPAPLFRVFDFNWNYRRDVTQSTYGRAQDRAIQLSSFSLGDLTAKRVLELKRPLILKKGEGAVFSVTPTLFLNTVAGDQFIVAFQGFGFRREPEAQ